jgi:copper chaperone CopZ
MNYKSLTNTLVALTIFSISASAQSIKTDNPTDVQNQTIKTLQLKVSGVTCGGDLKDIATGISKLNGVSSCKPVGKASATSEFEVSFNPEIVSEKEIRKVVESTPGCKNPDDRPYKVKQEVKEIKTVPTQN